MRLRRLIVGSAACFALVAGQANAIGALTQIGNGTSTSGYTGKSQVTNAACAAGSVVLLIGSTGVGSGTPSVTTTGGLTWYAATPYATATGTADSTDYAFYAFNAATLASGTALGVSYGATSTANGRMSEYCANGVSSFNNQTAWATGTSTTPSTATAALGSNPNGVLLVSIGDEDHNANAGWTVDGTHSWTRTYEQNFGGHTAVDYQIYAGTASVTDSPTLSSSQAWEITTLTFNGTPPAPLCVKGGLAMLGVGC